MRVVAEGVPEEGLSAPARDDGDRLGAGHAGSRAVGHACGDTREVVQRLGRLDATGLRAEQLMVDDRRDAKDDEDRGEPGGKLGKRMGGARCKGHDQRDDDEHGVGADQYGIGEQ